MAIAQIDTDTWIRHLLFTGGRRQTELGPMDGIFYGVVQATGDGSGGNLTLNANISFERKEDWVYILQASTVQVNAIVGSLDVFMVVNTGPQIQTAVGSSNVSMVWGGESDAIVNNAVTVFPAASGAGQQPWRGMPIFGDKQITGPLQMIAAGLETNTNLAIHTLSVWGWMIEYAAFFRNLAQR